jgi:hypothetical protein
MGGKCRQSTVQARQALYPNVFAQWAAARTSGDKQAIFRQYLLTGCDLGIFEGMIQRSINKRLSRERRYRKVTKKEHRAIAAMGCGSTRAGAAPSPPPNMIMRRT